MSLQNNTKSRWERKKKTQKVLEFKKEHVHVSQRAFADEHDIPRTTFQHWLTCYEQLQEQDPAATAFFESLEGLAWLHRIVSAAQFVITQLAGGSVRNVSTFLQLSHLDLFAASSTGTQHAAIVSMEQAICDFGQQERAHLAPEMPHRQMTLAEDETFHPAICLVALDLSTGFLLVERYAEGRDAKTWNEAIAEATEGLNVSVLQCVSDQARALIRHAEQGLGVHHSPDLFHIQQELIKGTSLPLAGQVKQAQTFLEDLQKEKASLLEQKRSYESNIDQRGPGRPPDWNGRLAKAKEAEDAALASLTEVQQRQEEVHGAIAAISEVYHPIELQKGTLKGAGQVKRQLAEKFETIEEGAQMASLSRRSMDRIAKAKRCVPHMAATIAFFLQLLAHRVLSLSLSSAQEKLFLNHLLPAFYLRKVARQQRLVEDRETLLKRAEELLRPWHQRDGPFATLGDDGRRQLEKSAQECAEDFARSSSCTEGRNAHLRQRHQSSHRLSDRKLGAATVIHNYFIEGTDGSTAAERFFGQKPRSLFTHLLEVLEVPRRPAKRRNQEAA